MSVCQNAFCTSLEQTESKYGEALAHSDDLTKHTVLVMRKIFLFFCQKMFITPLTDSLLSNVTVGSWVYSQSNFVML